MLLKLHLTLKYRALLFHSKFYLCGSQALLNNLVCHSPRSERSAYALGAATRLVNY